MTTQEVKRKLAAILSADVKGYSCLMGEDEEGTIRTLNAYKEVMANLITPACRIDSRRSFCSAREQESYSDGERASVAAVRC
jgi:hypothetical protein